MMLNFRSTVRAGEYVILLVLLALPLNSQSLGEGNLDSGQTTQADSSQQVFRRMDERFGGDKVINTVLNINDSNTAHVLNNFNVSKDEILRRISALQPGVVNNVSTRTADAETESQTQPNPSSQATGTEAEKQKMLMDAIKWQIESMVERNSSRHIPDWSTSAIHDMAFYPLCNKNNQTTWLEDNTAKLYFSSSIFDKLIPNTVLHRAILRLRQKIPDNQATAEQSVTGEPDPQNGCSDTIDVIHVKIFVFSKLRGDAKLKKHLCHTLTLNRVNNEWVEIDVRVVIKHWEKMYRASVIHNKGVPVADPMIAIEVEDEFSQPLKAGLFFEPSDCQASPAIPWSLYGENIRSLLGTQILPPNPRLDIKWSRRHRPYRHYGHRSHRLHNTNHLDNLSLLNDPPLMVADYQYQASTDQSDLNLVSMSASSRNHRRRHTQQRNHNTANTFNDRMRRSLDTNHRTHKTNTRRKLIAQSLQRTQNPSLLRSLRPLLFEI